VRVPDADRLEHDADDAWRAGPSVAMRQLAQPDALAVAVSAMVPSLTAVDAEGRPITPGLLYGDARGRGSTGRSPVASFAPEPGAFLTGEMAEFLRWTAKQAPEAAGYWPAPAVANYALAGEAVIDLATAGTAYPLFDGSGWSASACGELGVSTDRMPRVEMMGAAVGRVFGTDTVLAAGAIDALCEQLVAGADGEGDVLVVCGTTLIVWATTSQANEVPGLWTVPRLLPGLSQMGGASNAGGLFLNWVDRLVGQGNTTQSPTSQSDPRRVPVWSPYVRGERTPLHDPDRRAALDGLDLTHDAATLRRAAFEASAFVVRHLIDLSGVPVSRVVATGGGTRVEPWMQAIADATGVAVEVSGVAEGAALGAAFMARMAVGLESSMTDAARWASTQHIVEPDPAWTSATQDRYARFLELSGWPV
jgi:xylulokinase